MIYDFAPKGRVLDIGSGVGILGLLIGRDFDVKMSAVEKQNYLADYARHNYQINNIGVDLYVGDIADFETDYKYDYIVSNPPFYDSNVIQSQNERLNIARYAHHLPLATLISVAKKLIKPKGYMIFCYDAKQTDRVLHDLVEAKLNPEVIKYVHPKHDREAKIVLIAARANSKSMLRVMPPLIVFDDHDNYTVDAARAFEIASTNVITADREE